MKLSAGFRFLVDEHRMLVGRLGSVQRRCSDQLAGQAGEIERLQGEVMRLRGQLIARESALAYAREDLAELRAAVPGLPRRVELARRVETLKQRVQGLMGERCAPRTSTGAAERALADLHEKAVLCIGRDESGAQFARRMVEMAGGRFHLHRADDEEDHAALEASLHAADLVICQAGCVSHNAYWRARDHCRRTGKQCVLVDRPHALEVGRHRAEVLGAAEDSAHGG